MKWITSYNRLECILSLYLLLSSCLPLLLLLAFSPFWPPTFHLFYFRWNDNFNICLFEAERKSEEPSTPWCSFDPRYSYTPPAPFTFLFLPSSSPFFVHLFVNLFLEIKSLISTHPHQMIVMSATLNSPTKREIWKKGWMTHPVLVNCGAVSLPSSLSHHLVFAEDIGRILRSSIPLHPLSLSPSSPFTLYPPSIPHPPSISPSLPLSFSSSLFRFFFLIERRDGRTAD